MMHVVKLDDGRAASIEQRWDEKTTYDHRGNEIGRFSRQEWRGANLGLTKTGVWVLLPYSDWQDDDPQPGEISAAEAAGWFAACGIPLPESLSQEII